MSDKRIAHRFGGVWTEIKLKALTEYLDFYQVALKNQNFETWYVDAFAGTGDRHAAIERGGIFDGGPIEQIEQIFDGSARKALKVEPPFSHYVFIEQHQGRADVLRALKTEFESDITVKPGDANAELRSLFSSPPWSAGPSSLRQRGVVFLDPYAMSVEWATLEVLSATKRVDVWYLFPRKAVVQQLAHDIRGIDQHKRRKLSQIFGTDTWEEELYSNKSSQPGLFDDPQINSKGRKASASEISAYARERLHTLFCYVSESLPLLVKGNDFFELYCLSNNGPAIALIKRGVDHVIKKYTPASRRRSVP